MKKRLSIGSCIVLILVFCIATFLITVNVFKNQNNTELNELYEKESFYDKLNDVYNQVSSNFINSTDEAEFEDAYLSAYIDSLEDPYSIYLTADEMESYLADNSGELVGIGVHVAYDNETEGIYITGVMQNSPALDAGIIAGDIIVKIEDIELTSDTYYSAINSVRGKTGESVDLVIKRGEQHINFSVVRTEIVNESVLYEKLDSEIAYITITEFDGNTFEQFKNALDKASNDGCIKYIFDVRNNPGGDLGSIVSVLDLLLPEGTITEIVYKDGNITKKESDAACLNAPMVVLANGNTASAGELFTAALRDYNLATIVGTTTFGKGTMQTITKLADGSGLKLSTAYYNPPKGENYNGIGITPDVEVVMSDELMARFYMLTNEEDIQLQKAIEIIKSDNN
ncbi:MAG: hypothetical protein A2Y15_07415 [Clostridiales bacterium GWF2_36_10]|nr:MAG: hypothetical protein A2Y15_07415 [Clostridiales bacterium GWF2_36_10]